MVAELGRGFRTVRTLVTGSAWDLEASGTLAPLSNLPRSPEILEEDGALDKADLFYRRVCAISVDPAADILPEHQANDLGNRAVCLRKMDRLRESLELYDRVLAIPEADRAHLAPNRQTCLREMIEWTRTNGEYAGVRGMGRFLHEMRQ